MARQVVCSYQEFRRRKCRGIVEQVARAYNKAEPRPSRGWISSVLTEHRPFGNAKTSDWMPTYEAEISKVFGRIIEGEKTPAHIKNFWIT